MLFFAALLGLAVVFHVYFVLIWYLLPLTVFALYIVTGGWKKVWVSYWTLGRDIRYLAGVLSCQRKMQHFTDRNTTVGEIFYDLQIKHPDKVAVIDAETGIHFTYHEVETLSNKIANVFGKEGFKKGDCVCLVMNACPEYVCYWIGLSRIGVIVALLNTSIRSHAVVHCINAANAKGIIYQDCYEDTITAASSLLDESMKYYSIGERSSIKNSKPLPQLMTEASPSLPLKPDGQKLEDPFLYMYTSGTTGLQKAVILTHSRYTRTLLLCFKLFDMKANDIVYAPLPLHHSSAVLIGIGSCLINGLTCIIRNRFSASRYIEDCIHYKATVGVYVGEVCRYVLSRAPSPHDKEHSLRKVIGNGLRREIWKEFQSRFGIPQIFEFYGATEGGGLCNTDNTPFAVGFHFNIWLPRVTDILVRVDHDTGEILRGPDGQAIACKANEPGEVLFFVNDGPTKKLDCYVDQEANRKKYVRDIVKKGDVFRRTGDILVADDFGYLYFVDRAGDTFRWKSENVATMEVESTISKILGKKDVAVYGVKVPGCEGKAGMVTIADQDGEVDMSCLGEKLKHELPKFAIPLFAKVSKRLQITATFKYCKVEDSKVGYDPAAVGDDSLYFYDSKAGRYVTLDDELYQKIMSCELSL